MKCNLVEMVNLMGTNDMNQSQLANKSGVSISTVNNIVNGRSNPSVRTIYKFSQALGCKVGDLMEV